MLGWLLRLYHFNTLSLWLDEGSTQAFARLPWRTVLGFNGAYDLHPPLYYALVKLVALVVPETASGRLLSVVAGTLTIPVLYALAVRLLNRRVALMSGLLLAVCPLHIWYSQEARQYALCTLLVTLSYLALVAFYRAPAVWWAIVYGGAVWLAVYIDYSPVYALAPQAILLWCVVRRYGRRAGPIIAALFIAALGYLPLLPELIYTMQRPDRPAYRYLGASFVRVTASLRSIAGFTENHTYLWSTEQLPWEAWRLLHDLLLAGAIVALPIGLWALLRLSRLAALVITSLLVGTVSVAIVLSQVSPGYAERTVLPAVVGWSLLLAAIPFGLSRTGWLVRTLGITCLLCVAAIYAVSLYIVYFKADKQHWREMVTDTAAASQSGAAILTYPQITDTFLSLYAPQASGIKHIYLGPNGELPASLNGGANAEKLLWMAYYDVPELDRVRADLAAKGYVRAVHMQYPMGLYSDVYVLPGADLGPALPINGTLQGDGEHIEHWQLPEGNYALEPGEAGSRILALKNGGPGEQSAYAITQASSGGLYVLEMQAQSNLPPDQMRAYLVCSSNSTGITNTGPDPAGATIPNDGDWHPVTIATLCPAADSDLIVALHNSGQGVVRFKDVKVIQVEQDK